MKTMNYILVVSLVILALLGVGPVQALSWTDVGGNAASVYSTTVVTAVTHMPYGLYIAEKAGTTNMVICPMVSAYRNPVQSVWIHFSTLSTGRIYKIEVWDGPVLVKTLVPPSAYAWSGTNKQITLATGLTRIYNDGPTIVVYIAQASTGAGQFKFHGFGIGTQWPTYVKTTAYTAADSEPETR